MKKLVFTFTFFLFLCISTCYGKEGFSPYQQDGKWGVLYNGEPCLLPRYEQISNIDEGGRFVYKENEQWGIANVWKKITNAFCDSLVCLNSEKISFRVYSFTKAWSVSFRSYYLFAKQGKWGICTADGKEIIPPIYDEIHNKLLTIKELGLSQKDVKKTWQTYNCFFLVKEQDSYKIIDRFGSEIISDVASYDYLFSKQGKKTLSTLTKTIKKTKLDKETAYGTWKRDSYEATIPYVLYRGYSRDTSEPTRLYFGCVNEKFVQMEGDTMTICGMESIINDYGFISTPLVYDSPNYRLQRNPMDINALAAIVDGKSTQLAYGHYKYVINDSEVTSGVAEQDLILLQSKIKSFSELMEMANNMGDIDAYNEVKERRDDSQERYNIYKKNYDRAVKTMNFNAKVDRISGAATSFLNSMINVMGGNSSSSSAYSSSSSTSNGSKKSITNTSSTMSMADQVNYNSLRNTYNKWASDLMQMKNLNGKYQNGYSPSDKQHAQSEMKRIRENAKQRWGKEIPYNSIEDWR